MKKNVQIGLIISIIIIGILSWFTYNVFGPGSEIEEKSVWVEILSIQLGSEEHKLVTPYIQTSTQGHGTFVAFPTKGDPSAFTWVSLSKKTTYGWPFIEPKKSVPNVKCDEINKLVRSAQIEPVVLEYLDYVCQ